MARPRKPAAVGQAANRNACVRAWVLQMPRPQKRQTPSAVAPQTQQRTLQRLQVCCLALRGWDRGEVLGEALHEVTRDNRVQADFAGCLSQRFVTTVTADG